MKPLTRPGLPRISRVWFAIFSFVLACSGLGATQLAQATGSVGRTQGSFSVSPTGSGTYTIPIWSPPGPRGIQPWLALTYDSRAGAGPYGVGWTLTGLSAITRCNSTLAQDAKPAPITLTIGASGDRFCLDGKRLRLTSSESLSTYGQDGTTYQTEVADLSNITAHGSAGNGPSYFTVQRRDGLTYQYGFTDSDGNGVNSQVLASQAAPRSALTWLLSKVTDRAGNAMVINYTAGTGSAEPATIYWTHTSAGASTYSYSMQFTFGATGAGPGATHRYVAGTPVDDTTLLVSINVYGSTGGLVRTLVPTFAPSPTTGRYRLTQVQECADSAETNCLAPTVISYQDGQKGVTSTASTLPGGGVAIYDFNGDGRPDLAYQSGGTWYVALNTGSGFATPISTGITTAMSPVFGDVLGTGADGILANNGGTFYYYQYSSGSNSFTGVSTTLAFNASYTYALADITGDGRADLLAVSGQSVLTMANTSSGGTPRFSGSWFNAYTSSLSNVAGVTLLTNSGVNGGSLRTLDFNGDGRADVVLQIDQFFTQHGGGDYDVYNNIELLSNGPGQAFTAQALPSGRILYSIFFTNWNSDSCTDAVLGAIIYISGCNGSTPLTLSLPGNPTVLAVMDWDGDGRTDIIVANGSTLGVYQSTGNNVSALQSTSIPVSGSPYSYFVFDANGDGLDALGNSGSKTYLKHNGAGQPPDLASSITDGFGVNTTFTYVPITQHNYTEHTNGAYPDRDWIGPMYVVSQLTASDGAGGTYNQQFWYSGARLNLQGRGFEGFDTKRTLDSRTGLYHYQYYQRTFPYTGIQYQDLLAPTTAGHSIAQSTANYQSVTLDGTAGNQRYLPYAHDVTRQVWEFGGPKDNQQITTEVTTNGIPDNYGNFASVTTVTTDEDSGSPVPPASPYYGQQWTTTVATTVTPDTGIHWCLNLPSEVQVTRSASTAPAITRTVQYTPDYAMCHETQQIAEPGSSTYKLTEGYAFDSFGNVNSVSVTGANVIQCPSTSPCTTTTNWGTTGQFPMTVTNALGQPTQRNYNFDQGVQISQTDPNGLVTSWTPDSFGRTTQENRPDGTYTILQYSDCAATGCLVGSHGFQIASTVYGSDHSVVTDGTQYLDLFDRPILSKSRLLANGSYDRKDRRYSPLGLVSQEAAPCVWVSVATTCPYWTTMTYDALNRLTQTQRPISQSNSTLQTATVSYLGRTTITTDPQGKTATKVVTVAGPLGRSQDHDGYYHSFSYDAFGSLVGVSDSLNNTLFTAAYDYGVGAFQRDATDMDLDVSTAAGQHRHYTYDALGELTNWSDAGGHSSTATYDVLSRPLTRVEQDLSTTWTWGSVAANHEIGRLASVATSSYSEQYFYDTAGRVSKRRINAGTSCDTNTYCDYDFSYSVAGFVDHLAYPQMPTAYRFTPQYVYQNGVLSKIVDFNAPTQVYWQANATNARGQITQETLNSGTSGVVTNRSIDAVTGWVSSIQSGVGGGAALQNESYLFDYVGNLTQRQNNNLGLTENAYYDDLYRLDHTTLNGTTNTNLQMHYDAMGNVSSRSDIASGAAWTYDPNHKHQVLTAGDSSHTYSYDNDGNAATRNGYTINWASYNYPTSIAASGETVNFAYGPDRQRLTQSYTNSSGTETTFYIGRLTEKVINGSNTDFRFYVYVASRMVAVRDRTSTGTVTDRYVLNDQQGSVTAIVTSTGTAYVAESFTAYGDRRNAATWSGAPTSSDLTLMNAVTRQGYTGQTVLGTMGLTHLNGRVQDSITGRLLSADPYVPDPTVSQSFNRYSYVYNNPLSYVDPTGFCETGIPGADCLQQVVVNAAKNQQASAGFMDLGGAAGTASAGPDTLEEVVVTGHRPHNGNSKPPAKKPKPPCDLLEQIAGTINNLLAYVTEYMYVNNASIQYGVDAVAGNGLTSNGGTILYGSGSVSINLIGQLSVSYTTSNRLQGVARGIMGGIGPGAGFNTLAVNPGQSTPEVAVVGLAAGPGVMGSLSHDSTGGDVSLPAVGGLRDIAGGIGWAAAAGTADQTTFTTSPAVPRLMPTTCHL